MTAHEKSGVYLHLLHGRTDPEQDMDGFGDPGPIVGPFTTIQTTYLHEIRGVTDGEAVWAVKVHDDMIHFRSRYYGDWCVIAHGEAKRLLGLNMPTVYPVTPDGLTPCERH